MHIAREICFLCHASSAVPRRVAEVTVEELRHGSAMRLLCQALVAAVAVHVGLAEAMCLFPGLEIPLPSKEHRRPVVGQVSWRQLFEGLSDEAGDRIVCAFPNLPRGHPLVGDHGQGHLGVRDLGDLCASGSHASIGTVTC